MTLCEILNVVAPYPLASWGSRDARTIHYLTEAERLAYADRNAYLGDPDFVRNPVAQLLSPAYAAKLRAKIQPDRATPSADVRPGLGPPSNESADTTHYSIVDRWGNAVAVTYTINDSFGAESRRGRHGLSAQRRDGRFHVQAGRAEHVRARAGRAQRDRAGKASAVVDGADDRHERRQRCAW